MTSSAIRRASIAVAIASEVVIIGPRSARGDEVTDRKVEAKKLFEAGNAAISKKDFERGCSLMRQSLELFAVANSLFQVGMCYERENKLTTALTYWKRGLALVDPKDQRAQVAMRQIEAIEKRMPRIRILVPVRIAPVTIRIDDADVASNELNDPVPVDPGRHVITARKDGYKDKTFSVHVDEKQRTEVEVDVGAPTTVEKPQNESGGNGRAFRTTAFVALGVGAVGVVGAAITGGVLVSNDAAIDEKCADMTCDAETYDLVQEQRKVLPINTAMWVTAGVGFSTAVVFFIVASRVKQAPNQDIAVVPLAMTHGAGMSVVGRF